MDRSRLEVYTNSYPITTLPKQPYFHFDDIEPTVLTKGSAQEIISRLQTTYANIFNPRPIYDGRKNMFCTRDIQTGQYDIAMGRDRSKITHRVTIKRVSIINPGDVTKLLRPRNSSDSVEMNTMCLNLLQLIVRQAPNLRHHFPPDARSFYIEQGNKDLRVGLSVWRGFFQSVRPTMGRLLINVDVSNAAIYTPGYLIDTMMHFLKCRDIHELQTLPHAKYAQLRVFVKGLRIQVTTSPNMRPKPITDLVREAGMEEFSKDGETLTVKAHFESKHNVQVKYPRIVGVKIGRTAVVPAEFCKVIPGQVYRKKIPQEAQRGFLEFATQKPNIRFDSIENAVRGGMFNYTDSDFMKDAGMEVDTRRALTITGDVIHPPRIMYGGGQLMQVAPKAGSWNVVNRRFLRPMPVQSWAVAVFDNAADQRRVQEFVKGLARNMVKLGMTVPVDEPPIKKGNPSHPLPTLNDLYDILDSPRYRQKLGNPQLLFVFLPANAADTRRIVKYWGDTQKDIATQCVRGGKWERINDQYINNVALKINARLGGTNSAIDVPALQDLLAEAMVVGADVGHPAPGSNHRPSIAGFVATVSPDVSVMTSSARVQSPRVELIADLQNMMHDALGDWLSWRPRNLEKYRGQRICPPPQNVIFYRDGVSEGEFAQVVQHEIPKIKEAFVARGIPPAWTPKLLFIVVGKRHHVRFFPKNAHDADRSGNCPAGLLVDKEITNPNYEDFYLQSHAGLLGTSRPAHYVILVNETSLKKEQIQSLTFHLCHTYASATRSVSIPAPVYYADKICSRLEFHCADGASLSDTASNVTGGEGTEQFDLDMWRREIFKDVKFTAKRQNYFL